MLIALRHTVAIKLATPAFSTFEAVCVTFNRRT